MSSILSNLSNLTRTIFSLENSSKIGDLRFHFGAETTRQTNAVAPPILNNFPLPQAPLITQNANNAPLQGVSILSAPPGPAPEGAVSKSTLKKRRRAARAEISRQEAPPIVFSILSQRTVLPVTTSNRNFNLNRFAVRIVRNDTGGAANYMLRFINGPQHDVLMERATSFLARLQQPVIPAPVRTSLFVVSRLISGELLTNSVKPLKIVIPSISDLKGPEIFEFKSLSKRVKQGDAIAAFKLFQVCWTDRSDRNHFKAFYFLRMAKKLGCKAADAAFSIVYKSFRSDLLEAPIVRTIITNMDPYAPGFRLVGTSVTSTIQFGRPLLVQKTVKAPSLDLTQLLHQAHDLDPDACFTLYIYFFKRMKNILIQGNCELENIVNHYGLPSNLRSSKDIGWYFLDKAAELGNSHAQICISDKSKCYKNKKVYMEG